MICLSCLDAMLSISNMFFGFHRNKSLTSTSYMVCSSLPLLTATPFAFNFQHSFRKWRTRENKQ